MQRNNTEGVLSGWDKRWDIVQTVTNWMAQGSSQVLLWQSGTSTDLFTIDCIKINVFNNVKKNKVSSTFKCSVATMASGCHIGQYRYRSYP